MKNTGSDNYGGPLVTAGGLLFIGATNFDKKFPGVRQEQRKATYWETTLPAAGNATPSHLYSEWQTIRRHRVRRGKERSAIGKRHRRLRTGALKSRVASQASRRVRIGSHESRVGDHESRVAESRCDGTSVVTGHQSRRWEMPCS